MNSSNPLMPQKLKQRKTLYESILIKLLHESTLDLGNIQFSPNRVDGVSKNEPNTWDEKRMFSDILQWVEFSNSTPRFAENLRQLMTSPKYGNFFSPPKSGLIYRGMSEIPIKTISGWLKSSGNEDLSKKKSFEMDCNFVLEMQPESSVSSWTYSKKIAENFTDEGPGKSVVLTARVDQNPGVLLDLSKIQRAVPDLGPNGDEKEVLALGPVIVSKIRWW